MARAKYIIIVLSLLLLMGCRERISNSANVVEAEFSAHAPATRAYRTLWNQGDRIGIYMCTAGEDFAIQNILSQTSNIEYVANESGSHCLFSPAFNTIYMPEDNTEVDFLAYYPYTDVVYTGLNIAVNVQDQRNIEAIDYMVSQRVEGKGQNDNKVLFTFNHMLSLLEITLQGGYGATRAELEDMSVTICNSKNYGSLSIANGAVAARNYGDIVTQKAGDDITIDAIMIPQTFDDGNHAFLTVLHHGIIYKVPLEFNFIQSKRHKITLLIEDKKVYLSQNGVVVKDWSEGAGGSYDFEHKVVADGTQELDKTLFTLDNPHWVVRGRMGGDINHNYIVANNIREALDALPKEGSANGKIVLELENLTDLPTIEVLGVEKGAFEGYSQLKEVILSSSTKTLDNKAFAGCAFLQKISGAALTAIAESSFENCVSLLEIDMPQLQTAGNYAFKGCSSLKTAQLPQLTALSVEIFAGCSMLGAVSAPRAVTLYERAFSGCNAMTTLDLSAQGEIKMLVNPFSGFTNNAGCILTLSIDKQQGGLGQPLVTVNGAWGAVGKELLWKQIKFE